VTRTCDHVPRLTTGIGMLSTDRGSDTRASFRLGHHNAADPHPRHLPCPIRATGQGITHPPPSSGLGRARRAELAEPTAHSYGSGRGDPTPGRSVDPASEATVRALAYCESHTTTMPTPCLAKGMADRTEATRNAAADRRSETQHCDVMERNDFGGSG